MLCGWMSPSQIEREREREMCTVNAFTQYSIECHDLVLMEFDFHSLCGNHSVVERQVHRCC